MDKVTPETAIALKDAGFPQPKQPKFGDFFYMDNETLMFQREIPRKGFLSWEFLNCEPEEDGFYSAELAEHNSHTFTFAPTATDIMKKLGRGYVLWHEDKPNVGWFCRLTGTFSIEAGWPFYHQNPAEAAAQAWLHKNKKR